MIPLRAQVPDAKHYELLVPCQLKQAMGNEEHARITSETSSRFVCDYLGMLIEPLAQGLASSGVNYLGMTASLLLRRVRKEKAKRSAP